MKNNFIYTIHYVPCNTIGTSCKSIYWLSVFASKKGETFSLSGNAIILSYKKYKVNKETGDIQSL